MLHSEIHGPNWFRIPDLNDPSERCHRNKGTRLTDFFLSGLRDTSTVADATVSRKPISFCLIGVLWPSLFDFRVFLIIWTFQAQMRTSYFQFSIYFFLDIHQSFHQPYIVIIHLSCLQIIAIHDRDLSQRDHEWTSNNWSSNICRRSLHSGTLTVINQCYSLVNAPVKQVTYVQTTVVVAVTRKGDSGTMVRKILVAVSTDGDGFSCCA